MAAFSAKDFNAENYQAFRPSYPPSLYDTIYAYHSAGSNQWDLCLDLGCGTGISTRATAPKFKAVIGADPSEGMVESARKATPEGNVRYEVAPAEKLPFLQDGSVDLITAATSCQYFPFPSVWQEVSRVLRPGGTVAFFSYTVPQLGEPLTALNPLVHHFGASADALGPFVSPGFDAVMDLLDPIPSPPSEAGFDGKEERRIKYVGQHFPTKHVEDRQAVLLSTRMPWGALQKFHGSSSAVYNYAKAHPEDAQNPEGDITVRFIKRLKEEAEKTGFHEEEITVEVPMTLLLFRKLA